MFSGRGGKPGGGKSVKFTDRFFCPVFLFLFLSFPGVDRKTIVNQGFFLVFPGFYL